MHFLGKKMGRFIFICALIGRARGMAIGSAVGPARGLVGPAAGLMPPNFRLPNGRSVILFDGVCNFCNRWVQFVIDNDESKMFCFSSMQSPAGAALLAECGRPSDDLCAHFFTET